VRAVNRFELKQSARFITVALGLCLHLHAEDELVTRLLTLLGYDESSVISRAEMAVFLRRFQPLVPEDEFVREDGGVVYKISAILSLVSQPWFSGFEDAMVQEARWANEPPGTFAVRFSASYIGFYAIAVKAAKRVDHWRLMVTPRGFEVEEFISFATVGEVVTYYALHPLPDSQSTRLVTPGGTPSLNLQAYIQHIEGKSSAANNNAQGDAGKEAQTGDASSPNLNHNNNAKPIRCVVTTMLMKDRAKLDALQVEYGVDAEASSSSTSTAAMVDAISPLSSSSSVMPIIGSPSQYATSHMAASSSDAITAAAAMMQVGGGGSSSSAAPGGNALAKLEELMEPRGWLPFSAHQLHPTIDWSQVKVKEKLGSGGSGMNVYRATVNGLCCAVKIMEKAHFRPDQIRHFEEEVNMLRLVSECPHIVKYLNHTVTQSEICLYMEYLPASLFDIIKQRRSTLKHFSAYTIASVSLEIIKGIHYLHSHDPPILMRDIKSANVFVSVGPNDQFVDVKVGDFGVSREMSSNNKAQTFIGTPGWMCPTYVPFSHL